MVCIQIRTDVLSVLIRIQAVCKGYQWGCHVYTCKQYRFVVFAINVYKIGLRFTRTIACDQPRGVLIAFPNEKYSIKH